MATHQAARALTRGHTPARGPDALPAVRGNMYTTAGDKARAALGRAIARMPGMTGNWTARALCRALDDPDKMFPDPHDAKGVAKAKAVCSFCPVRAECLDHALSAPEKYGVWGGVEEDDRQKMRRARQRKAARKAPRAQPVDARADEPAQAACG